ncbi:MAG: DUF99 family protein [Thermofilaceae archaeon]|nr:DUF99 family protein [Thermofilaceae archaeon]
MGVSESFSRKATYSILAGVVMRRDLVIDGVALSKISVGGLDSTDGVLSIYRELNRQDIACIMINGCIISWFNIIDLERVNSETGLPVLSLTYEESQGIEHYIRKYFGNDERRLELYRKLGPRESVHIRRTGARVFVRYLGMSKREVEAVLNAFITHGSVPEPLRVASLFARANMKFATVQFGGKNN